MPNPYDKAHELARAITESEQYKNYVKAKEIIENTPANKEKLLDFRNRQMEVNEKQMWGEEIAQEVVLNLAQDFAKLNEVEEIANFFNAEANFINLFNDIQQIIQKKLENGLV